MNRIRGGPLPTALYQAVSRRPAPEATAKKIRGVKASKAIQAAYF